MCFFFESFRLRKKIMADAIAVQQHDDVVNLSTISHKKTEYSFVFGKYGEGDADKILDTFANTNQI